MELLKPQRCVVQEIGHVLFKETLTACYLWMVELLQYIMCASEWEVLAETAQPKLTMDSVDA